jgi:hypothetical protein
MHMGRSERQKHRVFCVGMNFWLASKNPFVCPLGPSLLGLHARCFTLRCWPLPLRCTPARRRGASSAPMTSLADEMGMGKTIQAISFILTARHLWPPGLAAPSPELAAVLARFPEPSAVAPSFAGRLHPRPEPPPTRASSPRRHPRLDLPPHAVIPSFERRLDEKKPLLPPSLSHRCLCKCLSLLEFVTVGRGRHSLCTEGTVQFSPPKCISLLKLAKTKRNVHWMQPRSHLLQEKKTKYLFLINGIRGHNFHHFLKADQRQIAMNSQLKLITGKVFQKNCMHVFLKKNEWHELKIKMTNK